MLNCPVCNHALGEKEFLVKFLSPYDGKEYKLYRCRICDVEFWEPRYLNLEIYERELRTTYAEFHAGVRQGLGKNHRFFLNRFAQSPGRLLDVGCGDGLFLKHIKGLGFEVWGIDVDRKSVETAKEKRGIERVYNMTLEDFSKLANERGIRFDYITMFEVLEHVVKPAEFLGVIKSILKEGGLVVGSVPNRDSVINVVFGRMADNWDYPPHHITWFSEKSLRRLFELQGFEVRLKELKSVSFGDAGWVGYYTTLGRLLPASVSRSKWVSLLRGLFSPIGLPIIFMSKGKYIFFEAKFT